MTRSMSDAAHVVAPTSSETETMTDLYHSSFGPPFREQLMQAIRDPRSAIHRPISPQDTSHDLSMPRTVSRQLRGTGLAKEANVGSSNYPQRASKWSRYLGCPKERCSTCGLRPLARGDEEKLKYVV
jgi:hypothetical protein